MAKSRGGPKRVPPSKPARRSLSVSREFVGRVGPSKAVIKREIKYFIPGIVLLLKNNQRQRAGRVMAPLIANLATTYALRGAGIEKPEKRVEMIDYVRRQGEKASGEGGVVLDKERIKRILDNKKKTEAFLSLVTRHGEYIRVVVNEIN